MDSLRRKCVALNIFHSVSLSLPFSSSLLSYFLHLNFPIYYSFKIPPPVPTRRNLSLLRRPFLFSVMPETSALSFSSTFSSVPSVPRSRTAVNSFLSTAFPFSSPPHNSHRRCLRFTCKASDPGDFLGDDSLSFFPWSGDDNAIEWVQQEKVTLFTADGLIQIGGSIVPRLVTSADKKQGKSKTSQRLQRFQESDYMDPNQGLCLGALFDIAATNGLDMGRRLCMLGFCRSIEMLSDVVEDTVLEHGGEVVAAEKAVKGGLHEKLKMTVAVPYLWGVPPASETLRLAVRSGGGIVEKVYWQWDFL